MSGKLPMGQKDLLRAKYMEMVVLKQIKLKDASTALKISYRQIKRIYRSYKLEGDKGLIHKNIGKPSPRKKNQVFRNQVISTYNEKYSDFGPTFASEKLLEDNNLKIDHDTLRRWLMEEGIWKKKKRKYKHRQRRDRRECFGELLQFDGSHHDWFEAKRSKCCLMNIVDDATGTTLSFLDEQETTVGGMRLLWKWIEKYGIPQAVYCDLKNAFVINREPTLEEQLANIIPKSPFEKACEKLGIEVIKAYSPQAKGRVERNHSVYQDRFIKELRLKNILTIEDANKYLENEYLEKINNKFAKPAIDSSDAHVPLLDIDMNDIFCFEDKRTVSNDYIIQYKNAVYQIIKANKNIPKPKSKVLVRRFLDNSIKIIWQNKELLVEKIA